MLYTLLLAEHYQCPVEWGLLFHTQNHQTVGITAPREFIMPLIMQRNTIAYHLSHAVMPELKRDAVFCTRCEQLPICMLVHRAREGGTAESSGLGKRFSEHTDHLTAAELDWYVKWDDLTRSEWAASDEVRAELWTLTSAERETHGRCFARMIVVDDGVLESRHGPLSDTMTFERQHVGNGPPLLDQAIGVGDHVVLSTEDGRFGVMTGFVMELSATRVTVDLRGPMTLPPVPLAGTASFHALVDIEDTAGHALPRRGHRSKLAQSVRIDTHTHTRAHTLRVRHRHV